jgi:hypothetical protein
MAEVTSVPMMEQHEHKYASNANANAGLTTGIIATSLAGLLTLGAIGGGNGLLGGLFGGNNSSCNSSPGVPTGWLYNERKETADYIELTKQYYEGQIKTNKELEQNFFDLYKMNVDNSFALYKGQRDTKDDLLAKIEAVDKKVDIMAAIRPYQDALIGCKIDNVAQVADFNLARRTCRMIQGELVLPSTPTVTGYASYNPCACQAAAATT